MITEPGDYTVGSTCPSGASRHLPTSVGRSALAGAAAAGAQALDLASLGRRHVVRTASHLTHKTLLLDLAAELAQGLLELLGILDDYSHNPSRIQAARGGLRR